MNPPPAPTIRPADQVEVNLDELSLPASPSDTMADFIHQGGKYDIAEALDEIIGVVETHIQRQQTLEKLKQDKATAEEMKESWGLGLEEPGRWLTDDDLAHRLIIPTIGPAKPRRIRMEYDDNVWYDYHFDVENMTPAERVATGGNMFRTVAVCEPGQLCALSMQPCQEKGPTQWKDYTGWEWCKIGAWQELCWRYHTEYLEPNGHVNTLGRWLVFLEE